jgi:hypothetical protein
MTTVARIIGAGLPALTAESIAGTSATNTLTAAGTTQADANPIRFDITCYGSVASGAGAVLPSTSDVGDTRFIKNVGANALLVYPPVGGQIDALSVNAAFSVPVGKGCTFIKCRSTTLTDFWLTQLGA